MFLPALRSVPFENPSLAPKIRFDLSVQRIGEVVALWYMLSALRSWSEHDQFASCAEQTHRITPLDEEPGVRHSDAPSWMGGGESLCGLFLTVAHSFQERAPDCVRHA
jgi:hypothetical protein